MSANSFALTEPVVIPGSAPKEPESVPDNLEAQWDQEDDKEFAQFDKLLDEVLSSGKNATTEDFAKMEALLQQTLDKYLNPAHRDRQLSELHNQVINCVEEISKILDKATESKAVPPAELEHLTGIVEAIKASSSLPDHLRVGFYGSSGAGKTTLLNKLLGYELLPSGDERAITAALTEVVGWEKKESTAIITFIALSDWENEVVEAQNELKMLREQNQYDDCPLTKAIVTSLKAMWGNSHEICGGSPKGGYTWEKKDLKDLLPKHCLYHLHKGSVVLRSDTLADMSEQLKQYADKAESLWPLIHKITVFGPFDLLVQGSFTLMDIPGCDDGDELLNRRYYDGITMCNRLYFVLGDRERPFTPLNANSCANAFTRQFEDFGIIITKLGERKKNWLADPERIFRDGIISHFTDDNSKILFGRTRVYCVESVNTDKVFVDLWNKFVSQEFLSDTPRFKHTLQHYINDTNLHFAALRDAVESSVGNQVGESSTTVDQLIKIFTNAQFQLPSNVQYVKKPSISYYELFEPLSYSQLQKLCDHLGHWRTTDVAATLVSLCLNDSTLQQIVRSVADEFEKLREKALNTLQDAFKGVQLANILKPVQEFLSTTPNFMSDVEKVAFFECKRVVKEGHCSSFISFRESGPGCKLKMRAAFYEWATDANLPSAVASTVEDTLLRLIKSEWDQQIAYNICRLKLFCKRNTPAITENCCLTELIPFLSPLSIKTALESEPQKYADCVPIGTQPAPSPEPSSMLKSFAPRDKLEALIQEFPSILNKFPDIRCSERTKKCGHVFALLHPAHLDDLCKIGVTKVFLPRRKNMQSVGSPQEFKAAGDWTTPDTQQFQKMMQYLFRQTRVNPNQEFEFFAAPLSLVLQVGDLVKQLIDTQSQ